MIYLFDVDGTLTPLRGVMNKSFKEFFIEWCEGKKVYLISGSDYAKTLEQVGEDLLMAVNGSFNDSGNSYYEKCKIVYRKRWVYSNRLTTFLIDILRESKYKKKFGTHIEFRTGTINFSTVGRNCNQEERMKYYYWDIKYKERKKICKKIKKYWKNLDAVIGGQISIDIYQKGCDKSQVVEKLKEPIYFYGDKTYKGGNDYTLAQKLKLPSLAFQVSSWVETLLLL